MNILQVISSSRTSGAERHMMVLSHWLRQRGHNVLAICPPGGWLPGQLREAGLPMIEMPMHGLRAPGAVLALQRVASAERIDVIHTHLTRATYMGFFAGSLARVPIVSTVHVLTRDWAYRYLPNRSHWFVAVSDFLRQGLIRRGVPQDRVSVVYNGTDFVQDDRIVPAGDLSVRAELGVPADAQLVGEFGRVDSFKGQHIVIRAAEDIVDRCPKAYFVFVGHAEPGIQQTLWEMAVERGVGDRLRFTGVRNDVPRLMAAMDVVALPSITESCSMAIIEAMSLGKPVVATRAGGNVELVAEAKTGFLVDRTPEAVGSAIAELLADARRRTEMGMAGRDRALEHFTAPVMAGNMEGLYKQVLASAGARQPLAR